jgi:hypothetical protein
MPRKIINEYPNGGQQSKTMRQQRKEGGFAGEPPWQDPS